MTFASRPPGSPRRARRTVLTIAALSGALLVTACSPSSSGGGRAGATARSPSRCGRGGSRTRRRTTRSSTCTRRPTRASTVDFKAFKNTEYNQILTTGLAGSSGPDVAAGAFLRPAAAHGRLQEPRAAGRHGRPERLGRERRQERQGQGGRQALRRPAGPADAPDVLQQGPVRQAGPEAADDVGRVHRGQRQAEGARHHADGRRRQGRLDAADRAPGAGRARGSAARRSRRPC